MTPALEPPSRWSDLALFAVLPLALGACAPAGGAETAAPAPEAFFPAEFGDEVWIRMADFEEPQLHADHALDGFAARYRLSIVGLACNEYVLRIDERAGGQVTGWAKVRNRCERGAARDYTERRFIAGREGLRELDALFAAANMFELYPEFWDPGALCIDGHQLLFERRDTAGYRVSIANAQCTAPPAMLQATRKFIALSGETGAGGLLQ